MTAVRRHNVRTITPGPDTRVEAGDVLVLLGTAENLAASEILLLQG